jgi:hypothetical protein
LRLWQDTLTRYCCSAVVIRKCFRPNIYAWFNLELLAPVDTYIKP